MMTRRYFWRGTVGTLVGAMLAPFVRARAPLSKTLTGAEVIRRQVVGVPGTNPASNSIYLDAGVKLDGGSIGDRRGRRRAWMLQREYDRLQSQIADTINHSMGFD